MSVRQITLRRALVFAAAAILIVVAVIAAGCGGSSSSNTTATGPLVTHVTNPASGGAQTVQVIMTNRSYDPKEITVNVGDTVTWVNQDAPQHDVVADKGEFKSDLFDKGASFSFTFTTAGTYPYHCSIHPGMVGTVIVK
jgi:plastocyanin